MFIVGPGKPGGYRGVWVLQTHGLTQGRVLINHCGNPD